MTPEEQQKLERLIHRTLRELPTRSAPPSLESRVQAELARRAALPWWRKSFLSWPLPARAVFVVACGALVKLVLMATGWASAGVSTAQVKSTFASELQWAKTGTNLFNSATDLTATLLGSIPPLWLYGGIATIVALYVALFGLGAAAYRTLYASN